MLGLVAVKGKRTYKLIRSACAARDLRTHYAPVPTRHSDTRREINKRGDRTLHYFWSTPERRAQVDAILAQYRQQIAKSPNDKRRYIRSLGQTRVRKLRDSHRIASWNVQGISDIKLYQLTRDCARLHVDVLGMQETHSHSAEPTTSHISNDYVYIDFGVSDASTPPGTGGLALVLHVDRYNELEWFRKISDRVAVAMARQGTRKVYYVIAYAPTLMASQWRTPAARRSFYADLDTAVRLAPSRARMLVMGDFNAKVGRVASAELAPDCIGIHGKGTRNANGEWLIEWASSHRLSITNTFFKNAAGKKTTWASPARISWRSGKLFYVNNQIDFILVRNRERPLVRNSRAYPLTEMQSDHRLLICDIARINTQPATRANWRSTKAPEKPRIDIDKLRDSAARATYQTDVDARIARLDANDLVWQDVADNLQTAALRVCGEVAPQRRFAKRWVEDRQVALLSRRQKAIRDQHYSVTDMPARARLKRERKIAVGRMRGRIRQLHDENADRLVREIESTRNHAKQHALAVRRLKTRRGDRGIYIHNADGNLVVGTRAQLAHASRGFQEVFGAEATPTVLFSRRAPLVHPITADEVQGIIAHMANGKAAGLDDTQAELLKYAISGEMAHALPQLIATVLNRGFELGSLDAAIVEGKLVFFQKPGKKKGPRDSLRPITILTVLRKVLATVGLRRSMRTPLRNYLPLTQHAFLAGRSTADVVWTHRVTSNVVLNALLFIYWLLSIDLSAAFDSPQRSLILAAMREATNDDPDTCRIARALLSSTWLRAALNEYLTEFWAATIGSPQGDSFSPTKFNVTYEYALRRIRPLYPPRPQADLRLMFSQELQYADDLDQISTSKEYLDAVEATMCAELPRYGLKPNPTKTVKLRVSRADTEWRSVKILGSLLGDKEDIAYRMASGTKAFCALYRGFISRHASLRTKVRLYNAYVLPVILYNIGCTGLTESYWDRLDRYHRRHLRRILGSRRWQDMANDAVYALTNTKPLSVTAAERRWQQFGHCLRKLPDSPQWRAILLATDTTVKKRRGRPTMGLWQQLTQDYARIRQLHLSPRDTDKYEKLNAVKRARLLTNRQRDLKRISRNDAMTLQRLATDRALWQTLAGKVVAAVTAHRRAKEEKRGEIADRRRFERYQRMLSNSIAVADVPQLAHAIGRPLDNGIPAAPPPTRPALNRFWESFLANGNS